MMFKTLRVLVAAVALVGAVALVASDADARIGGGFSSGSRGTRTFSAPAATPTAPSGSMMQRSTTQPSVNNPGFTPSTGGFFGRPGFFGGGLFGGLMGGFLGAGLFGLLFGHGLFGGLGGGIFSFLGLIFQVGLIALIGMFVWRYFQRRNEPAFAGPSYRDGSNVRPLGVGGLGSGMGGGGSGPAQRSDDIGIAGPDYDAFEHLLSEIQAAYSAEDIGALRAKATPEMVSYFSEDLAQNASRGLVNHVTDVKLEQGDLAEAWREGNVDYATVAMRFSLNDSMVERATGRVVEGDPNTPQVVTELWTFRRSDRGPWLLSAIQQAN
jgi:predicted lipid-binding transport protein (Tim44 family)